MRQTGSRWLRSCGLPLIGVWAVGMMWLPVPGSAQSPRTIDELEYETAIDHSLFSSEFNLKNWSGVSLGGYGAVQISSEIGADPAGVDDEIHTGSGLSVSRTDPLVVKRISASLVNESGTLTVGSDWTDFQDVLTRDRVLGTEDRENPVFRRIRWLSPDGFSISLEEPSSISGQGGDGLSMQEDGQDVSSLILSWQGGSGGRAGEYRVAALGTRLDVASSGQHLDARDVHGWGLKLEGGWQIGDLFAALSATYGKGINRYILRRYGNELLVMANADADPADAYSIRPSLYYSLNENAHFHVALGHHAVDSSSSPETAGLDTLDTIHMGYNWSPWPSTEFGIELVGRSPNGTRGDQGKTRFRFGARRNF